MKTVEVAFLCLALLPGCKRKEDNQKKKTPALSAIRKAVKIIADDGRDGAAVILTDTGSDNWIQFALMPESGLHFSLPRLSSTVPGFDKPGPYEKVSEMPEIPNAIMREFLKEDQIEPLRQFLDHSNTRHWYHYSVCFDANRKPLATIVSFQFAVPLDTPDLSEFILDAYETLYPGQDPTGFSIESFRISWD